jgi:CheY-like chemotaxis protein
MPSQTQDQPKAVPSLHLSEPEQFRLLDELNAVAAETKPKVNQRRHPREVMPPALTVRLDVRQPGGSDQSYWVRARDISDGGIGILYGGFLHNESHCTVEIYRDSHQLVSISADVVRCRYLRNSVHEVGLKFAGPLDSALILKGQPILPGGVEEEALPQMPRLKGHVLYTEPSEADRRYVCVRLTQMGLTFRCCQGLEDTLEAAKAEQFNLILTDYDLQPDPASYLIRRLRSAGNRTPILVTGSNIARTAAQELAEIGANSCLPKPFNALKLAESLAEYLPEDKSEGPQKKRGLTSELWREPEMRPLIIDFVNQLQVKVDQLSDELLGQPRADGDPAADTRRLAATSSLYGYPPLQEALGELVTLLSIDPLPAQMITEQMLSLENLTRDAREALN